MCILLLINYNNTGYYLGYMQSCCKKRDPDTETEHRAASLPQGQCRGELTTQLGAGHLSGQPEPRPHLSSIYTLSTLVRICVFVSSGAT